MSNTGLDGGAILSFGAPSISKCVFTNNTGTNDGGAFLVINPQALPSGTGVGIFDDPGTEIPLPSPGTPGSGRPAGINGPPAGITGPLGVGLVYASQQCTG